MDLYKHNWHVPDWQDKAAYPKANELTDDQWLWEFLRRRIDYRKDWLNHSENIKGDTAPHLAHCIGTTEKYGLWGDCLLDPTLSVNELPDGEPHFTNTSGKTHDFDTMIACPELADTLVNYQFDLAKPLEPQLKEAKITLKSEREYRGIKDPDKRIRRPQYPSYLRVLDAINMPKNERPTYAKIGKIIFDSEDPFDAASKVKDAEAGIKTANAALMAAHLVFNKQRKSIKY